jgi:2-dehydropantoate 2-reductase
MKIAILGCGAIGGLCLGYLSRKELDVIGIVRDYQLQPLNEEGLLIEGRGESQAIRVRVDSQLREPVDCAIFATKISDLKTVIAANYEFLKTAVVVSTQNGIRADYILGEYFAKDKIITGIIMFGATFYSPNRIVHNFGEEFVVGNIFSETPKAMEEVETILGSCFSVTTLDNIKGAKYLKVLINVNNCIPAILGKSMQEVFADKDLAGLAVELNKEAYGVMTKSGIELASLPNYPKERLENLLSMPPSEAANIFSKVMTNLSKEPLYGSILQSIQRKRKSEIDYINGEINDLAKVNGLTAPLNEKIIELVHSVENSGVFLDKEALLTRISSVKEKES